jgi:hypothetical protein
MRGGFLCPECRLVLPAIHPLFVWFFRGESVACPKCKKVLPSLWDLALDTVREDWTYQGVFQLSGAKQTYARAPLKADRVISIDLKRWRIPRNAEILKLTLNALGPSEGPITVPLRWEGNQLDPRPHILNVYGATYGRKPIAGSELMVAISWIAPGPDEVSVHHLAEATKQFEARRYNGVVIPANIAVEAALARALTDWVGVFCTKGEIGEFFTRGATYAHQLKVLAPIAADTMRLSRLDPTIRGHLAQLRKYRNELGHAGTTTSPALGKDRAGQLLTAAIFGYHYARYLHTGVARLRRRRKAVGES